MLLRVKKKSSKIVPESPHTMHLQCWRNMTAGLAVCSYAHLYGKQLDLQVNGINSTYMNWRTRRLTFQLYVQPEALCHSLSLARLFRCQAFFQSEISNSCCWPYVMHTDGVINVIKKPAVINRLKHSSSCTACCNTETLCFLFTDCAYGFHAVLTVNTSYFPNSICQLVSVMERQPLCSCLTHQLHKFQAFWGYHNNVTNLIHFHFHNHFIVS
jgi:hypothetical protein